MFLQFLNDLKIDYYLIKKIIRCSNNVKIICDTENKFLYYDKVVIATHANDALDLIEDPLNDEYRILKNFKYKENIAVIHFDESIMPKNKKVWCSWNALMRFNDLNKSSVTYWLNLLQNLKIKKNIFLTINPFCKIAENKIYKKIKFDHPYYDESALMHQRQLKLIQNKGNILFCGSYFGYGFHEDGIKSSIEMLKSIND